MAQLTTKHVDITYVLELSEAEARYVKAALTNTDPAQDLGRGTSFDTVWQALDDAGIEPDGSELE